MRGPDDDGAVGWPSGGTMSARTYRAGSMKEALAQVRRDLGGGAVILGTREVRRRRLFGLGTRELIEVTASATEAASARTASGPASAAVTVATAPGPKSGALQ